jgi:hypothetical protein
MSTIRRGSTATGHLVWGTAQPITLVDVNAHPKPPDPTAKATIESYQSDVMAGQSSHCVAKIIEGHPTSFRWLYMSGGTYALAAEVPASQLTYDYLFHVAGAYGIALQTVVNGKVTDQTDATRVIYVHATPEPPKPEPPQMQPLPGQQTIVSPFSYDEFIQNNPSEVDYYAEAYTRAHGQPPGQKDLAQCFYRRLFEGWTPAHIWDDIYVGAGKPIPPDNPFR